MSFKKGDKVWLEAKNLKIPYASRKLAPKREGPFIIDKVMGPVTCKLKLPLKWKIHPVFHISLLTPYHETQVHGENFLEPPPDLIDNEPEWEVEVILVHKMKGGTKGKPNMVYLVKWKGYASSDNTWEPERNLKHAEEILNKYKRRAGISN